MKKVLVILIVLCCCAPLARGQNGWPYSEGVSVPYAQMSSTAPSMMSMQAHDRLSEACHTSFSVNHTSVQDIESPSGRGSIIHRVGPEKPNEPGVPVGDGIPFLLLLVVLYSLCRSARRSGCFLHSIR